MNTENTIELNGKQLIVDALLKDFVIHQKPSSNVEYYGLDFGNNSMFVQFKGGTGSYIYNDVPDVLLSASNVCASIGKFISAALVGNYPSTKLEEKLIKSNAIETNNSDQEPSF